MVLLLIASNIKVPGNPSSQRNIRSTIYTLTNQKRSCTLTDLFLLLFDMLTKWENSAEATNIRVSYHECLKDIESEQKCRNERKWKIFLLIRIISQERTKQNSDFFFIRAVNSCLFGWCLLVEKKE